MQQHKITAFKLQELKVSMQKHYYDNVGIFESVAKSPNHFVYNLVSTLHQKTVFIMDKLFQSYFGGKPESNSIKHRFAKVCGKYGHQWPPKIWLINE